MARVRSFCTFVLFASAFLAASTAFAGHVSPALDVPVFWTGMPGDGYLEFINPTEHPLLIGTPVFTSPPGAIHTEEFTGYTLGDGTDIIEIGDSDTTAGDRADFDWVQENRAIEFGGGGNHAPVVGAMGWTVGSPEVSPHIDPGTGAPHGHALPELENETYSQAFFTGVDVFSIISEGEDHDADAAGLFSPRDAALDYVVDFGNTVTGHATPGIPIKVWVPGWTGATGIDDYVARWVPSDPGLYNVVAIEPAFGFGPESGHDEVTEIDAVKAFNTIPEPATFVIWSLLGVLGITVGWWRRRQKAA